MAVTLRHQVGELGQQVAIRCVHIEKFNLIKARLDEFCKALAKTSVSPLGTRTVISEKGGERSLKMLFIIMQVISDLKEIENLGKLHAKTVQLRKSTAALEVEVNGLHAEVEELRRVTVSLKFL